MNKTRRFVSFLLVFSLISVVLAACGSSNPVLGKWESTDGSGETIEFFKDETFVMESSIGLNISGTYSVEDSDKIKLDMEGLWGLNGPTIATLSNKGTTLTLSLSGVDFEYEKVE